MLQYELWQDLQYMLEHGHMQCTGYVQWSSLLIKIWDIVVIG